MNTVDFCIFILTFVFSKSDHGMLKEKNAMMKYLGGDVYFHCLNLKIINDESTSN